MAEVLPPLGALPPMERPLLVNEHGEALVPHAFLHGTHLVVPVFAGIGVGWSPISPASAVLAIFAGNPADPSDFAIACQISRDGLARLASDLQSIVDQLDGRS